MGKLFGREKKTTEEDEENISAFLRGPSDKSQLTGASLPVLSKIDTSNARRWPTAAEVNRLREPSRRRSASPKRSKKGHVRFTEKEPEIIGEGGDEADSPTMEISDRKRSSSHPPVIQQYPSGRSSQAISFRSGRSPSPKAVAQRTQAEMRADEGRALTLRLDSNSTNEPPPVENDHQSNNSLAPLPIRPDPAYKPSRTTSTSSRQVNVEDGETRPKEALPSTAKSLTHSFHAISVTAVDNAFQEFSDRVKHLSKLFELSASSTSPITATSFEDLVATASWWFLRGRMNIENTVKDQPSSAQGRNNNYNILRQQGHTDLAKALWIVSDVISQRPEIGAHRVHELHALIKTVRDAGREYLADALDRCQSIYTNIGKVAVSMKRHDCLPLPVEETLLSQSIDNTIWIAYPSFTFDIQAILSGQNSGSLSQVAMSSRKISDLMPLGDTREAFVYSRIWVDVFLIEGIESQQFRYSSILSITRLHKEKGLTLMIASQTCQVALCIQSNKATGLTWNDVTWQTRVNAIDIKLSKGFVARVQCSPSDFKMFWNMYDYTSKVHAGFQPQKNEDIALEMNIKAFQYFSGESQSRGFPKEPIPKCHVRIFEKKQTELGGYGARSKHRGFRIAITTHASTRNLNGVTHELSTQRPIEYSFMRGEDGSPALLLSINEKAAAKKSTMVLNFDDSHKRSELHNCITGGARKEETVSMYIPVKHFSVTAASPLCPLKGDNTLNNIFAWQGIRIINASNVESESQQLVPSEGLRITIDSKTGSVTDRINVGPGELRLWLSAQPAVNEINLLRQPEEDLTISVLESQVSKEVPRELSDLLGAISKSQTIRKYGFSTIEDLHIFQTAITGFSILFDSIAESFSISRRRMVVPIHKKWEASVARVQVLRQNKVVQLAAFFENFSHGKCMNFVLKMTDTFESFNRNGKFYIRIIDAKFAALDEADEDIKKDFVCLDIPDYPGEHDDITITFESETSTFI